MTCTTCGGAIGTPCPDAAAPTCSDCCEHADQDRVEIPGQLGLDGAEIVATTSRPERIGGAW